MTLRVCKRLELTPKIKRLLEPALGNFTMNDLTAWIDEGAAMIWDIGGLCYAVTVANSDNELEVILAGGRNARECIGPWEKAVLEAPEHKGMTLRTEARRGWKKLLPHWNCIKDADGMVVLVKRV